MSILTLEIEAVSPGTNDVFKLKILLLPIYILQKSLVNPSS